MAGFPTFASSVPSAPPLPLSSLPPWLRRLQMDVHSGDWIAAIPVPPWMLAVLVSITASTFTVAGFVLQKKALHDPGRRLWPKLGNVVLSPGWIVGFLLTALLPVLGDLVAYSLAPLSLTTPLSGVSVVLNMVIAPWALSEKLQRFPDVPATVLILLGCLLTTMFGDHDRTGPFNLEEYVTLLSSISHCAFFSNGCLIIVIGICLFSRRQPNGNAYATDDEKTGLLDLPDMAGDNTPRDAMGSAGGRERVARSGLKERAERDLDEL